MSKNYGLTEKQKALFEFIKSHVESDGIAPSFDEMKDHLGLKSKSGVHRLVTALDERGYIHRLSHRARAIAITDGSNPASTITQVRGLSDCMKIEQVLRQVNADHRSKVSGLREIARINGDLKRHFQAVIS